MSAPTITVGAVDVTKNPAYLRALAIDVDMFRDEFVNFLELCVFTPMTLAPGLLPPVTRKEGVTEEAYSEAKERVSRAAGRIANLPAPARMRIAVVGVGEFDVIDAWLTVTQPKPLFYPDDVLAVCNGIIGRLEGMIKRAEAEEPLQVDVEAMNPLIWGAARKLWNDEHHREAVLAASGALVQHVKQLTGMFDVDETKVWQLVFSSDEPQIDRPRLRWPGDPKDQTVRSMKDSSLRSGVARFVTPDSWPDADHRAAGCGAALGVESLPSGWSHASSSRRRTLSRADVPSSDEFNSATS